MCTINSHMAVRFSVFRAKKHFYLERVKYFQAFISLMFCISWIHVCMVRVFLCLHLSRIYEYLELQVFYLSFCVDNPVFPYPHG